jgi:hypothetical protein
MGASIDGTVKDLGSDSRFRHRQTSTYYKEETMTSITRREFVKGIATSPKKSGNGYRLPSETLKMRISDGITPHPAPLL